MCDCYSHIEINIIYVEENIPGPLEQSDEYRSLIEEFNSQLMHNCTCEFACRENICSCLGLSGGKNFTCAESQNLKNYVISPNKNLNAHPIIECNELCKCSQECGNRLVQKGPIQNLFVKASEGKGLGLFTKCFITKGSFICEYAGEVLTKAEVLRRHKNNQMNGRMNYIFCLNEYANEQVIQTFVDPSMFGNIGRYVNHSCEPTCKIIPVRVNSPIPKLAIFNLVDILPYNEITFDYGSHNLANFTDETSANRKVCLCKSSKCRGYLPYDVY